MHLVLGTIEQPGEGRFKDVADRSLSFYEEHALPVKRIISGTCHGMSQRPRLALEARGGGVHLGALCSMCHCGLPGQLSVLEDEESHSGRGSLGPRLLDLVSVYEKARREASFSSLTPREAPSVTRCSSMTMCTSET